MDDSCGKKWFSVKTIRKKKMFKKENEENKRSVKTNKEMRLEEN